jgi:hypothetical protein
MIYKHSNKQRKLEGKWAYLNHYLGKPFFAKCGRDSIEGVLYKVDPENRIATVLPTILYDSKNQPYVEKETPTYLSLNLFDFATHDAIVQPLKSLEDRIEWVNQINTPKAKIGFEV